MIGGFSLCVCWLTSEVTYYMIYNDILQSTVPIYCSFWLMVKLMWPIDVKRQGNISKWEALMPSINLVRLIWSYFEWDQLDGMSCIRFDADILAIFIIPYWYDFMDYACILFGFWHNIFGLFLSSCSNRLLLTDSDVFSFSSFKVDSYREATNHRLSKWGIHSLEWTVI